MEVLLGFVVTVGVPFFAAVALDAIRMRRLVRAILIASVPAITLLLLFEPTYSLADIGLPFLLVLIACAWLAGFTFAPLLRGLWHVAKPS